MTAPQNQMHSNWAIFGLDETGPDQLRDWHLQSLRNAKIVIADERFHNMLQDAGAKTIEDWPKPFSDIVTRLADYKDDPIAIFATGDPMFYGAGATIKRYFPNQNIQIWPALSGIQLAASHMGWSLSCCEVISIHGRPATRIIPHIYPFAKWLVIPQGAKSISEVADILIARNCGDAHITVLNALGRQDAKTNICKTANEWQTQSANGLDDFCILAIDLSPAGRMVHHSASGVLPDDAFISDGKLTKQDVRASALSKLQPHPHGVLWDLGTGCGSIAIEWARTYDSCRAYGVDNRDDRLQRARANAQALGTPTVSWIEGDIYQAMTKLPEPDAIFIGGGLSSQAIADAMHYLPVGGRLVCHAVTLESEALLLEAHHHHGGQLTRIAVNKAEPVGGYFGWRGLMPVTQWVFIAQSEGSEND